MARAPHPRHVPCVSRQLQRLGAWWVIPRVVRAVATDVVVGAALRSVAVARHDPELWVEALDGNYSEQPVELEAALAEALEALPHLILDALSEITVAAAMRASRGLAAERRNGGRSWQYAWCVAKPSARRPSG